MSDEATEQQDKQDEKAQQDDAQDSDKQGSDEQDGGKQDDKPDVERYESGQIKEMPEPTDEQKKEADKQREAYTEERPTTVLPGTAHTVTGTAVNDWIDDDGNPKFGEAEGDTEDEHRTVAKTDDRKNVADEDAEDNQD